ncbi:MAG: hypothetical protein WC054_00330 [Candidatus Nanopelagicales bacterium]
MTNTEIPLDHYVWISVAELTDSPAGIVMCYKNYWWLLDEQGRVAFYNPLQRNGRRMQRGMGSAQANLNRSMAERISKDRSWVRSIELIPSAFVKIDPAEYV